MKSIISRGLIVGVALFIISYGGLYLSIRFFPSLFVEYINPIFNSDGTRDILFYLHAFIISMALTWFWDKFKGLYKGNSFMKGLEFGCSYVLVAILPVMWITFSSLDITIYMVLSWLFYGFVQATVAGWILVKIDK